MGDSRYNILITNNTFIRLYRRGGQVLSKLDDIPDQVRVSRYSDNIVKRSLDSSDEVYAGVKEASEHLKSQGVSRNYRKQILESFDVRTIKMQTTGDSAFGIRFYGGKANAKGRYLFETFSPLTNRYNLALPYEWNSMTGIQQFQVKSGAKIITGNAANQIRFGSQYIGGAKQWFILNLEVLIKCQ